ncbi:helix-turn-helix transcriptional regulator [Aedoeadaptatus coli]|uniref:helix-turn-helix transcriptional regulator n=1 Tax=Aedoeadaptatus coli TaxID=2058292 RepID=UPI000D55A4D7|nr:helix-turn-helix transcriptional regulator [Peptoniphilus coli]
MGNNIKRIRKQKGMTQGDLSEMVGVTRQYISDVENLKKIPSVKIAFDISKALETNVYELFYYLG